MPCAPTHRLINVVVAGAGLAALHEQGKGERLPHPMVGAALSGCFATLPDLLEPATNPHHRQALHSLAFAGLMGYGVYRLYQWQPETPMEEVLRVLAMMAGAGYLLHLAADFCTKRSLPVIGKL
jgi:hypothetical protein